jgi:hypothetical protein
MTTERSDGLKQSSSFADNDWIDDDAVFVDETCLREPRDDAAASDRRSRSPPFSLSKRCIPDFVGHAGGVKGN